MSQPNSELWRHVIQENFRDILSPTFAWRIQMALWTRGYDDFMVEQCVDSLDSVLCWRGRSGWYKLRIANDLRTTDEQQEFLTLLVTTLELCSGDEPCDP